VKSFSVVVLLLFVSFVGNLLADDFVLLHEEDVKMQRAFKHAKSTLEQFLRLVDKGRNPRYIFGAYVQVVDKEQTEYLWVTDLQKYNDEYYIGYVISSPRLVSTVKKGATIGFRKSDIFDWQKYDKNTRITHGAYTSCALMDPATQEDAQYIKENGLQCTRKNILPTCCYNNESP